jgi:small subunit ribosomal protein S16
MLKIRLKRTGKKNSPSYRIVVADSRSPRDGKAKEELGWYNPSEDPDQVVYDKERLQYWTQNGAQMTEAVEKLIEGNYEFEPYTRQNEKEPDSHKETEEQPEASEEPAEQSQEQEEEEKDEEHEKEKEEEPLEKSES